MELNREDQNFLNLHDHDRDFLKEIRRMSDKELHIHLKYQSCEEWRRVAIEREMERRVKIEEETA
jgi:hypothetical protein